MRGESEEGGEVGGQGEGWWKGGEGVQGIDYEEGF